MEEAFEHVLRCQHPDTVQFREEQLEQLYNTLVGLGTPSVVIATIKQGFSHWISNSYWSQTPTYGSVKRADILLTSA